MIREATAALSMIHEKHLSSAPVPARHNAPALALAGSDESILQRAFASASGSKIRLLFSHGDTSGYPSHSEADQALANHLVYWTSGDATQADRLFRASKLMRPKWDEQRGQMTYGEKTIATARTSYRPPVQSVSDVAWRDVPPPDDDDAPFEQSFDGSTLLRAEAESRAPTFLSLADLIQRSELLAPPRMVVPRLAFAGRATCLAAPDKAGKSTLASAAATALSRRGAFLGEVCGGTTGRVAWIGIEEALGDAVLRFANDRAAPDNVQLVVESSSKLLERTRELLREWPADLVMVDSLTEYARVVHGTVPLDGDSAGWSAVVRPLVALTREFPQTALLILHHTARSHGQYRGPIEIAAAVDCLLEMRPPKDNEPRTRRFVTGRARWLVPDFSIDYEGGSYRIAGHGELSLDARILHFVGQHSGVSQTKLREGLGGRAGVVDKAVADLVLRGVLRDHGTGGAHAFYLPGEQEALV